MNDWTSFEFMTKKDKAFESKYDQIFVSKSIEWMYKYVIFLYTLLVCLFVCVFVSNKRQTAEPIRPNFFVGPHHTPIKVYERSKLRNIASNKIRFP